MDHDEQAFLDEYSADAFNRPSVTVDVALLTTVENELRVLVVRRPDHPYLGSWALPGGFVGIDEPLAAAAARVLQAKAGIGDVFLEQLYTFGAPGRDPRTRVISVSYYGLVAWERVSALDLGVDTEIARVAVPWSGEQGGPVGIDVIGSEAPLAFDHADILGMAVKRIRGKLNYTPIGYQLLPEQFTLLQLQRVHETIAGESLNKDSFRRRMLASDEIEATGEREAGVGHRPAALYRFTKRSAI
jgi:8-oxo-dGTP diphosphatase